MYEIQITAGATWLDEMEPGWATYIDRDSFNIRNGYYCVIGQVLRYLTDSDDANFYDAVSFGGREPQVPSRLQMTYGEAKTHGFNGNHTTDWDALQAEWLGVLTARHTG